MARVVLARRAVENLSNLMRTHSLSADTMTSVRSALQPLEAFPELGRELGGRWAGHRAVLGPWRWMLLVYRVDTANERVVEVTIQDARAA